MSTGCRNIVIALAAFAVGCGGSSPYLKSVTEYAGTVTEGAKSLEVVPDTLGSLCGKRAIARYVKGRFLGTTHTPWNAYLALEKDGHRIRL